MNKHQGTKPGLKKPHHNITTTAKRKVVTKAKRVSAKPRHHGKPSTTPLTTSSLTDLATTSAPLTTSIATLYAPRPRVVPAGLPKGLPPKVVKTVIQLTTAEIQAEEERHRYIVKEFYKSKAKWNPHPKLAQCNDVHALECYLWDHQLRLRWFRGRIADKANRHVRRSYFRTHISIHKKTVKYIEDKIFALKGELRIPKLFAPLAPTYTDEVNHFLNHITLVDRPIRDYDYPMKAEFEPLAHQEKTWQGSQAERVKQI